MSALRKTSTRLALCLAIPPAALASGCRDKQRPIPAPAWMTPARSARPSADPPSPSALFAPLIAEARSPAEIETDPSGPAGDLQADIKAFTDLRSCVRRHRLGDPLLSDAVEALGYDTLLTDACRLLEALKARDRAPCLPISASAVRRRCEAQVAMLTGEPSLCPTEPLELTAPRHEPLCLAVARRDLRLCVPLLGVERATCEGLLAHDPARCGTDDHCVRLLQRWSNSLPAVIGLTPYAGQIGVEIRTHDDEADGGERAETIALETEAARGAVLVHAGKKTRLSIGETRGFFLTDERSGGGFVAELPEWPVSKRDVALTAVSLRITLRARSFGALELSTSIPATLTVLELTVEPGSPVRLRLTATLGPLSAPRRTVWTVDTWLRDVVVLPSPAASAPPR